MQREPCEVCMDRRAYYHWIIKGKNQFQDEKLNELIESVFKSSRRLYGTRRIKKALIAKIWNYCIKKENC